MEILLASGNTHKKQELEKILPGHTLLTPADLDIPFDHEETGHTFSDNARGKALALHKLTGKPVLADDSGICVPALGGAPGIYSARYGSSPGEPEMAAPDRNALLLKNMEGIEDRRAFFVCAMVLLFDEYRHYTIQETLEGVLTHAPAGTGGFGYDPLFYLDTYGKTVAELPAVEKNRISHRGKAGARMALLLNQASANP